MERCLGVGSSAMAGVSGKGGLQPADSRLGGRLLLHVGGHRLGVEVVAVFVEGVCSLRAHEAVDRAEAQDLPCVLRQFDGLERAVIALHPNLHDAVSSPGSGRRGGGPACMIPRGSTHANSQVPASYGRSRGLPAIGRCLRMLLPGKSYRRTPRRAGGSNMLFSRPLPLARIDKRGALPWI